MGIAPQRFDSIEFNRIQLQFAFIRYYWMKKLSSTKKAVGNESALLLNQFIC